MIRDVTDLEVYNKALELLPKLYKLLNKLPRTEFDLKYQTQKAAQSVPATIAEGFAKRLFIKEFKRYLLISLGSNDEVISHLRTTAILFPNLSKETSDLINDYKIQSKRVNSLHKNWRFNK